MQVGSSMISEALSAIQRAEERFTAAVGRIAEGDLDNLASDWADLSLAKVQQAAGVKVLRAALDDQRSVLDILV